MGADDLTKRSAIFSILLLSAGAIALCWRVVFLGEVLSGPDLVNYFIPTAAFGREWLREGALPLWNSLTFCGWPLVGDAQMRWLFPPNLLLLALKPAIAFSVLSILYVAAAAFGMWCYLRFAAGVSSGSALCGAATFGFSGFFAGHLMGGIVVFLATAAWMPWILLLGWKLGRGRNQLATVLLLGVAISFQVLSGAPQIVFYTWVALAFQGAWRVLDDLLRGKPAEASRTVVLYGIACLLGAALSASAMLPASEFGALSFQRGKKPELDYFAESSFDLRYLWLLAAPRFFFDPHVAGTYWGGKEGYWDISSYTGIGSVGLFFMVLCFAGISAGRFLWGRMIHRGGSDGAAGEEVERSCSVAHRGFLAFHVVLAVFALLMAFGRHSPLFRLLYTYIPGFDMFRVPARWVLIWQFSLAAILGLAVDGLFLGTRETWITRRQAWLPIAALAVLLVLAASRTGELQELAGIRNYIPDFRASSNHPHHVNIRSVGLISLGRGAGFATAWALLILAGPYLRRMGKGHVGIGLAGLLVFADVLSFGVRIPTTYSIRRQEQEFLRASPLIDSLQKEADGHRILALDDVHAWTVDQNQPELWANRAMVHGLRDARGYYPLCLRWFGEFINALSGFPAERPVGGLLFVGPGARLNMRLLTLLDVKTLLSYEPLENTGLVHVLKNDFGLNLFEVEKRLPPARIVSAVMSDSTDAAHNLSLMTSGKIDYKSEALVAEPAPEGWADSHTTATGSVVSFERTAPTRFDLDIERVGSDLIVLSEAFHPGWRARVDGRPAQVVRADHTFIGVRVPPGTRRVEVRFEPFSFRIGLYFCFAAWLAVTATIVAARRRRPKRTS